MSTSQIVTLLIEERDKIVAAISALKADDDSGLPTGKAEDAASGLPTGKRRGRPPTNKSANVSVAEPFTAAATKRRPMSAEGKKRIADAVRARWAKVNAAKAEAAAPKKGASKKSAVLAAVTPPAEDTEFKAKMSAAMKKAWKRRKKAAKK